jgi:hypothetical protein
MTTDATTGDMGILFDVPTLYKTMMGNAMNNSRNIQYRANKSYRTSYILLIRTPTHLYILPLRTKADDFIDILLQPPISKGNGRSIAIDLKDAIKTKINNIQTIALSTDGNPYTHFPARIVGNNVQLYSLHCKIKFHLYGSVIFPR